jgi:hypothetical protein
MLRRRPLRPLVALLIGGLVLVTVPGSTGAGAHAATRPPVRACASLATLRLPDTTVIRAATVSGGAVGSAAGLPAFCDVVLAVNHPPATDRVTVEVWLPVATWNGRFEGTGGSGYAGGSFIAELAPAIRAGYAVAATDAGHAGGSPAFALDPDGNLDWPLITDFGSAGIHDMTVTGKAVVAAYYGLAPAVSYFTGCSTGGRQGLMEAQRYPADYNGIVAGAPAINWTRLHPAQLWGQLVMRLAGDFVPRCKFSAITDAVVAACDRLDGVADGVIADWAGCHFDARTLIGTRTPCGTITATDADLVNRIWQGPGLWYGLLPGTDFSALDGAVPFSIALQWFQYWLTRDPHWDWRTLDYAGYLQLFQRSIDEFGTAMATDDPDLSAFRRAGGKLLVWHGLADPIVFPQGTVDYYQRVRQAAGGPAGTDQFLRLFLAPGVQHCGGGPGDTPVDTLGAVVDWVEHGHPPDQIPARRLGVDGRVEQTRPVCRYPLVPRYQGHGSTDLAADFSCAATFN